MLGRIVLNSLKCAFQEIQSLKDVSNKIRSSQKKNVIKRFILLFTRNRVAEWKSYNFMILYFMNSFSLYLRFRSRIFASDLVFVTGKRSVPGFPQSSYTLMGNQGCPGFLQSSYTHFLKSKTGQEFRNLPTHTFGKSRMGRIFAIFLHTLFKIQD